MLSVLALVVAALVVAAPAAVAQADEGRAEPRPNGAAGGGNLTLYLDNDLFGGTDQNYTNGVRASWISEGEPLLNLFPARRQLEQLSGGGDRGFSLVQALSGFEQRSIDEGTLALNYGASLTQLMYTPRDFTSPVQPAGERRYAGWLGLGFSVHAGDRAAVNSVELIFGTTGPNSLAEEAQDLIHGLFGYPKFQGWQDQIPNELTVDVSFTQKRRLRLLRPGPSGFAVDGFGEAGLRLGSFRTGGFLGILLRAGFNLSPDFSDPRLSATAYSHRYFDADHPLIRPWSAYALFGFRGTGIAHDATLEGPLFRDFDTGNSRRPFVGEAFAGFGLRYRTVELSYVHSFRTREFEEQRDDSDFGSFALRMRL